MSCGRTHHGPALEAAGAPGDQSRAAAQIGALNHMVWMVADDTPVPGPSGWSNSFLRGLRGDQRHYAQEYVSYLECRSVEPDTDEMPEKVAAAIRGRLHDLVKKSGAQFCPNCHRFMGEAGCVNCPSLNKTADENADAQTAMQAEQGAPSTPQKLQDNLPDSFASDNEFAGWLTQESESAFGDPAQWTTLAGAESHQTYMAVMFKEPQSIEAVKDHLSYVVQRGPLQTDDFSSLDIGTPTLGVRGEQNGKARLFYFRCDWDSSRRTAGFKAEAEAVLKKYLTEGTPVRTTNRAGQGSKGTRRHSGKGECYFAFTDRIRVDAAVIAQFAGAPLMSALVPAREAYAAAISELHHFIPRCMGCGRFLPTQNPICVNPKCGLREQPHSFSLDGQEQPFGPVPWPPPGYTFKKSRVKSRGEAASAPPPSQISEAQWEEMLSQAPPVALGGSTTDEAAVQASASKEEGSAPVPAAVPNPFDERHAKLNATRILWLAQRLSTYLEDPRPFALLPLAAEIQQWTDEAAELARAAEAYRARQMPEAEFLEMLKQAAGVSHQCAECGNFVTTGGEGHKPGCGQSRQPTAKEVDPTLVTETPGVLPPQAEAEDETGDGDPEALLMQLKAEVAALEQEHESLLDEEQGLGEESAA